MNDISLFHWSCIYEPKGGNDTPSRKTKGENDDGYYRVKTHPTEPQRNNGTLWRAFLRKNFSEKLLDT
jgi:hypothetical protein